MASRLTGVPAPASLGACLSFCAGGVGLLWALADEEKLAWHDHMSKTFPTHRGIRTAASFAETSVNYAAGLPHP